MTQALGCEGETWDGEKKGGAGSCPPGIWEQFLQGLAA